MISSFVKDQLVNTMAADALAPCVARASAAMVLTWFSQNILVPAPNGLNNTTTPNLYLINLHVIHNYGTDNTITWIKWYNAWIKLYNLVHSARLKKASRSDPCWQIIKHEDVSQGNHEKLLNVNNPERNQVMCRGKEIEFPSIWNVIALLALTINELSKVIYDITIVSKAIHVYTYNTSANCDTILG